MTDNTRQDTPKVLVIVGRILIILGVINLIPGLINLLIVAFQIMFLHGTSGSPSPIAPSPEAGPAPILGLNLLFRSWFEIFNAILWLYAGLKLKKGSKTGWYVIISEFLCYSVVSIVSIFIFFHFLSPFDNVITNYRYSPLKLFGSLFFLLPLGHLGNYLYILVSAGFRIFTVVFLARPKIREYFGLSYRPWISLAWVLSCVFVLIGLNQLGWMQTQSIKKKWEMRQLQEKDKHAAEENIFQGRAR